MPFKFQYMEEEMRNATVLPTMEIATTCKTMAGREGKVKR